MAKQLTESLEDYLETIAELIAEEGHAHTKKIAERLNVRMPSVTSILQQLEQMNYITYRPRYPVVLTAEGKQAADRVIRRHQVLHKFFLDILGLPFDKAEETACRVEHSIEEEDIERFELLSQALKNRSDARVLQTYITEAMEFLDLDGGIRHYITASELKIGEKGIVEKCGRNLEGKEIPGIAPGTELTLLKISLDKTLLFFQVNGRKQEIPQNIAENIWVKQA
ncbi:MAG: metal-dependent transcriptional regulator [Lentisphaeria bacterium]|nr:metal-dependent transcriptional regulator [Lentisphaeria bacterium]